MAVAAARWPHGRRHCAAGDRRRHHHAHAARSPVIHLDAEVGRGARRVHLLRRRLLADVLLLLLLLVVILRQPSRTRRGPTPGLRVRLRLLLLLHWGVVQAAGHIYSHKAVLLWPSTLLLRVIPARPTCPCHVSGGRRTSFAPGCRRGVQSTCCLARDHAILILSCTLDLNRVCAF